MLTDPIEIEIISKARQPNVRDPKRRREPFFRIFESFLSSVDFTDQSVLDLGPGQFDFCLLAKERGATECAAIDNDPAVVELGHHRDYTISETDLKDLADNPFPNKKFDGLFCKYSFNAFWFHNSESDHRAFLESLLNLIESDGWAWLSPWNGIPKDLTDTSAADFQRAFFIENGFTVYELTDEQSDEYGIHGTTFNRVIFTKNLPPVGDLEIIHPPQKRGFLSRLFGQK